MSAVISPTSISDAASALREELRKTGIKFFVTSDPVIPRIEVYGLPNLKAFVPKKFNGWPVAFFKWHGKDVTIDIDVQISLI